MYGLQTLVIAFAAAGGVAAAIAAIGRLSGRLGQPMVDRLYYVSYGCTGIGIALFIAHGLFAARP